MKALMGSNPPMHARTPLVVFEPAPPVPRIVPTVPLGPWAMPSIDRMLRATAPGGPVTLDLCAGSVADPAHVAAVLWADDVARELGVRLEVVVPDMVSAELLDFAGVHAPVFTPEEHPLAAPAVRRVSA